MRRGTGLRGPLARRRGDRREGASLSPRAGAALVGLTAGALAAALLAAGVPGAAQAQEDPIEVRIRESENRLREIREEREQLQREMERLRSRVSTVSEELRNLERQTGFTASAIAELDAQIMARGEEADRITREMLRTRDELTVRKTELRARLRSVYKRGPMAPVQVLLAANSFADLINRYKYLRLVTLYDRMLVREVSRLERRLEEYRRELERELGRLKALRAEKQGELLELEELEDRRERRLASYRVQESRVETRWVRLREEQERLQELVTALERARREAERRSGRASTSSLRTADLGNLDWPVEGEILYQFGVERNGDFTIVREGIGIGTSPGTPVRAVEAGRVELARSRGSYGPSVIVSHGGGFYSTYHYLRNLRVSRGQRIEKGAVVGEVGRGTTREGPHLMFQIFEPSQSGEPRPVDPVRWLRGRP